jgi:hypothetical protein
MVKMVNFILCKFYHDNKVIMADESSNADSQPAYITEGIHMWHEIDKIRWKDHKSKYQSTKRIRKSYYSCKENYLNKIKELTSYTWK